MDIVSIIVPVYNAQRTLKRCIVSIMNQTYKDIELVLINDGSKDKSARICDRYAEIDNRIKVIHKENGGASSARNVGIDNAIGKYFLFVDSDDWLPQNAVQLHVEAMNNYPVQITSLSSETFGMLKRTKETENISRCLINLSTDPEADMAVTKLDTVTRQLYIASIIKDNKIKFPLDISYGEDTIFSWNYLRYCENAYFMPETGYYCDRIFYGSMTFRYHEYMGVWRNDIVSMLKDICIEKNIPDYDDAYCYYIISAFHFSINNYVRLPSEMDAKAKIREFLTLFYPHIAACEEIKKKNNEPRDHVMYTRNADLIYDKFAGDKAKFNFKKMLRKYIAKFVGPFLEHKYTALVVAGKM